MDRALYGVEEAYHYHGQLIGRRRRFNEPLVRFILRNRAIWIVTASNEGERGKAEGIIATSSTYDEAK